MRFGPSSHESHGASGLCMEFVLAWGFEGHQPKSIQKVPGEFPKGPHSLATAYDMRCPCAVLARFRGELQKVHRNQDLTGMFSPCTGCKACMGTWESL